MCSIVKNFLGINSEFTLRLLTLTVLHFRLDEPEILGLALGRRDKETPVTPHQQAAVERLREFNRKTRETPSTRARDLVLAEIEVVIALLEDEPMKEHEPMPIVERRRWPECQCPDRGCGVIKAEVRCRFPKCNCTFPRRCRA